MFSFFKKWLAKGKENGFPFVDYPPHQIAINPELSDVAQPLWKKIDQALTDTFKEKVFRNYQTKNPSITREELEWRWHELKKFFFLAVLFKQVPMFSKLVDDLWHEMILFTRDYHQFCERLGVKIEHEPHIAPRFNPDERAYFDLIYSSFFQVEKATTYFYGEFFQYPLPEKVKTIFLQGDKQAFLSQYVRNTEQSRDIAEKLWTVLTKQMKESDSSADEKTSSPFGPLETHAYWVPTWFLLGNIPDRERDDGGAVYPWENDSSDGSACSSCSGCSS